MLWFDVGIKRYTTTRPHKGTTPKLWFDVGIKRYTTDNFQNGQCRRCGLMQESKDIQLRPNCYLQPVGCGLMQESKDIQPNDNQ